ncbi:CBR-HIF-1 protein [Loa loa]|uniref:CBR-HIF-1 protein n=1 Tax=Loa loa TaxID=7209 RepID=A0A1S0UI39_LOALO|nr:CBR-HIF-1 protein [Loa loa]EJD75096.1 CBR-HIF-1 protein [Loa loa]
MPVTLDRRRESSRFAARDRRGKEADIFTDLKVVVPIVDEATVTHVDRIAILRVALTLCRLRKVVTKFLRINPEEEREYFWSETTLLECLDGFLAIVDLDGIILYVSESVSIYLGLTQTDLTGRSLKEFIHTSDYEEYVSCDTGSATDRGCGRVYTLRMKSVISPRGRNLNLKNAVFKPIICHIRSLSAENGRVRIIQASAQPAGQGNGVFAASRNAEVQNGTYLTRHTYDMKFSYVSESFNYILRHESRSLMGTSFYNLIHPADLDVVVVSIREMLTKGHTRTPYYRLIGLNKSVLWVQTEAATVNHTTKGQKGQYIICLHQLIGTQSERDSFINANNSSASFYPAPIKQEVTESSEPMRSSYNEVLQWLFRAQQSSKSPPGSLLFGNESNKNRIEYNSESTATRVEITNYGTKNGITVSGASNYVYENNSNNAFVHNGNGGAEFHAFATEIDRCRLRTNNVRANCGGGPTNGNIRNCTNHCFQTDFSESTTAAILNTVRLSAVSTADAYLLPQNNINTGATTVTATGRSSGNIFPTLSTKGTQYSRSMTCYDPYLNNSITAATATSSNTILAFNNNSIHMQSNLSTSPMNCTTEIPRVAYNKENGGNDTIEGTDDWQMFAPFVAHDDMMQLSTDLQGLLPDFNFVDWIPSDPAPLPSLPAEERGMTLLGNVSIPMQMAFDRSNIYANSSIPLLSKPNTRGLPATPWRQLQQQNQQCHQENMNTGTATATPWLEVELTATYTRSNDYPSGMFHRNNSTASMQ